MILQMDSQLAWTGATGGKGKEQGSKSKRGTFKKMIGGAHNYKHVTPPE